MAKLKPCPFCGGENLLVGTAREIEVDCGDDDSFAVCCNYRKGGCGAVSGYRDSKKEAIEAWNRRTENG